MKFNENHLKGSEDMERHKLKGKSHDLDLKSV